MSLNYVCSINACWPEENYSAIGGKDMRERQAVGAPGTRPIRAALQAELRESLEIQQLEQECPNTFVKITVKHNGENLAARGWSKVTWPDTWSAAEGQRVAVDKALAKIAKFVMRRGEG